MAGSKQIRSVSADARDDPRIECHIQCLTDVSGWKKVQATLDPLLMTDCSAHGHSGLNGLVLSVFPGDTAFQL